MKITLFTLALVILIPANLWCQNQYDFHFGTGKQTSEEQAIQEVIEYSDSIGYGFDFQNREEIKLNKHNCTSSLPYYFSVKLPEGVYQVDITLGNKKQKSITTVKAESRRLMLRNIEVPRSGSTQKSIIVNVRSPKIDNNRSISLKTRSLNYLNWDQKLTLEFSGEKPSIQAITISPVKSPFTTIFLAGNSTVTDQDCSPWASWGQMITEHLNNEVVIANYAESGSSLAAFKGAGRLDKVLSLMQEGDYLFIEFGHNDQKRKGEGIGPWVSFTYLLNEFITKTREKGGIPILVTPTQRRSFDKKGIIQLTHGDYPAAMRKVAIEREVPLIDVHKMSKELYETWGINESKLAFVHYPAHTFPGQDKELKDNTHFNEFGANEIASCVLQGIIDLKLPIQKFISNEKFSYSPSTPHHFVDWDVPMSPRYVSEKPAGN